MRPLSMYGAALLLLALTVFVAVPVAAQGEITIQLAVNTFFQDVFEERVIPEFEAQNPGVKVHLVVLDGFGNPLNSGDTVTDYLDDAAEYLTGADVVPLDTNILRTATHAGYLLDLSPLADTDAALDAGDFYPSAYNAFRWDGGLWGLPVTVDAIQVYYDRQAFDEAGLSYPNGSWTVADYASAIRALTPLDSDGTPSELAVQVFGEASQYFFASLAGDVLDDSVLPNVPDYSSPVLAEVAEAWIALNQEGYLTPPSQGAVFTIGGDEEPVPLTIGGSNFAGAGPSSVDRIGVAPLPGNQTVVTASGYGVSAGTRYPEAAYALVKFLSASPDAAAFSFGGSPARRSVEPAANTGGPGGARLVVGGGNFSAEVQAAIDLALETGRPAADFAFSNGLESAMQTVLSGTTSLEMALQEAEAGILSDLQTADQRRSTPLVVDAPPAPVVVAQGEVALNFAVSTFVNPSPNQEWGEQLAAEHDQLSEFAVGDLGPDPQVVRDDRQALGGQVLGHLERRGTAVEEQGLAVVDHCGHRGADHGLLRLVQGLLERVGSVGLADRERTTVRALDEVELLEPGEVSPDGRGIDVERSGQLRDAAVAVLEELVEDLGSPRHVAVSFAILCTPGCLDTHHSASAGVADGRIARKRANCPKVG